ncbi:MAG: nicotinate-nucleotide adenylyltransferase [Bacillota bacterium]|nr:nicotinate-nucleotide adenylyltransferase [Bacillota bacterium]
MNVGYFGGTFDPIHNGHLHMLDAATKVFALDLVIVMPAGMPYHKDLLAVSPACFRYMMCRRALSRRPEVVLSAAEIRRRGPSYTIDTVHDLKRDFLPGDRFYLICGSDILDTIQHWYHFEELLTELVLAVAIRPGENRSRLEQRAQELQRRYGAEVILYDTPMLPVSSTAIRQQIEESRGRSPADLPPGVMRIIRRYGLYREPNPMVWLQPETRRQVVELESKLFDLISLKRLAHSVSTMFEAIRLAKRFGGDVNRAAIAALLHDFAKELTVSEMRALAPALESDPRDSNATLHGPAAGQLLESVFGINDPEIADAITWHTTLREGATMLDKIIFLADKIEPSRTFGDLGPIREKAERDLDEAVLATLEGVRQHLIREKLKVHPASLAAMGELMRERPDASGKGSRKIKIKVKKKRKKDD